MKKVVVMMVVMLGFAAQSHADSIYGSCTTGEGKVCSQEIYTVSTSWNSKKAFPNKSGKYELDLGSSIKNQKIEVYCNGKSQGSVTVSGDTRFDVVCR